MNELGTWRWNTVLVSHEDTVESGSEEKNGADVDSSSSQNGTDGADGDRTLSISQISGTIGTSHDT